MLVAWLIVGGSAVDIEAILFGSALNASENQLPGIAPLSKDIGNAYFGLSLMVTIPQLNHRLWW
jgi:hypothetical protein